MAISISHTNSQTMRRIERQSTHRIRPDRKPTSAIAFFITALAAAPAHATFHFMHVEQVIGGVNGDAEAQAIQLRMRFAQQHLVDRGRLVAWDANGENPIVLIDFDEPVTQSAAGSRILVASAGFVPYTDPPIEADFVLTNPIPVSYVAAGSITFISDEDDFVVCRLSWGGASYTGDTTAAMTNDDDGELGPPFPSPLPHESVAALLYQGDFAGPSTTNAADYALTDGAAVFTNNAGDEFTVRVAECPLTAEQDPIDTDGDGVGSFCDGCPEDPDKTSPGECGCGVPDVDEDNDGQIDCPTEDPDNNPPDNDPPDDDTGTDPDDPTSDGDDPDDNTDPDGDDPDNSNNDDSNGSETGGGSGGTACGLGMIPAVLFSACAMFGLRLRRIRRF